MLMRSFNSSDGRVVRAPACGGVDSGLIPSRVKPMALKFAFTASLLDYHSINGTMWKASQQVRLLCCWEGHIEGLSPSWCSRQVTDNS